MSCCCCLLGFNVAFNNFSFVSQRCLVATGSWMLTFIVLPHWSIMPQTLDMIQHPVTLSRHIILIEPVISRSPKRTLSFYRKSDIWTLSWEKGHGSCSICVPSNGHAQLSNGARSPALGLKLSLDPYICLSKQPRLWWDCVKVQAYLSLCCPTVVSTLFTFADSFINYPVPWNLKLFDYF